LIVSVVLVLIISWISAMVWFPGVAEISSRIMGPAKRFLDAMGDRISDAGFPKAAFSLVVAPFLAMGAVVIVHELGHLIAGLMVGLEFVTIRFGPLVVHSPFRISFRRGLGGYAGATSMVPRQARGIRWRFLVMLFAGPAANVISSGAVMKLVGSTSVFMDWLVLLSVMVGLGNLVPFARRSLVSDGKRVLMLLRGGGQGERWIAVVQLVADLRNGVPPEDLRPELLGMATAIRDDSVDTVAGHALAYTSAWYARTADEAARILETCLQYLGFAPPILREGILADAGVFQGRKRSRADLAREWLTELPAKTQYPGLRLRVEAAILEAEGDIRGSLRKLDEVESTLQRVPNRQQRALSMRSLERWRSELTKMFQAEPATLSSSS
jgi:hypothetical protein